MDRAKQREIASKGGKAAHQKGTAHEWTSEEAREAGRKGGMASHRRRSELTGSTSEDAQNTASSSDMSERDDSSNEQIR
jgi:general stress protein YciG